MGSLVTAPPKHKCMDVTFLVITCDHRVSSGIIIKYESKMGSSLSQIGLTASVSWSSLSVTFLFSVFRCKLEEPPVHRDEQLGEGPMLLSSGAPGAFLSELGGAIGKGQGDGNWRGPSQTY